MNKYIRNYGNKEYATLVLNQAREAGFKVDTYISTKLWTEGDCVLYLYEDAKPYERNCGWDDSKRASSTKNMQEVHLGYLIQLKEKSYPALQLNKNTSAVITKEHINITVERDFHGKETFKFPISIIDQLVAAKKQLT